MSSAQPPAQQVFRLGTWDAGQLARAAGIQQRGQGKGGRSYLAVDIFQPVGTLGLTL